MFSTEVLSCEIRDVFKNTYFEERDLMELSEEHEEFNFTLFFLDSPNMHLYFKPTFGTVLTLPRWVSKAVAQRCFKRKLKFK